MAIPWKYLTAITTGTSLCQAGPLGTNQIDGTGGGPVNTPAQEGFIKWDPFDGLGNYNGFTFGQGGGGTNLNAWWSWQGAQVGDIFSTCGGDINFDIKSDFTWLFREVGARAGVLPLMSAMTGTGLFLHTP